MARHVKLPAINELSVTPVRGVTAQHCGQLVWDDVVHDHDLYQFYWRTEAREEPPLQDGEFALVDLCMFDFTTHKLRGGPIDYIKRNMLLDEVPDRQTGIIIAALGDEAEQPHDKRVAIYPNIILSNVSAGDLARASGLSFDRKRLVPCASQDFSQNARPMLGRLFAPEDTAPFSVTMHSSVSLHFG